jgi:hypothetical protein
MTRPLFDLDQYTVVPDESPTSQSCDVGLVAELEFLPRARRNGWHVYSPHGHATPADVILFRPPHRPISVQIKKGTYQRDAGKWKAIVGSGKPSCAANPNDYGKRFTAYSRGDFDVLAMYVEEHDVFVFWTLDELLDRALTTIQWRAEGKSDNWEIFDSFTSQQAALAPSWAGSSVARSGVTNTSASISLN